MSGDPIPPIPSTVVGQNPDWPLWAWRDAINELIRTYGEETWLYTKTGNGNGVQLVVVSEGPSDPQV